MTNVETSTIYILEFVLSTPRVVFQREVLALHVLQACGVVSSFNFHRRMSSLHTAWFTEPCLINVTINPQVLVQECHCSRAASNPADIHSLPQGSIISRHGQLLSFSAFPPPNTLHLNMAQLYVPLLGWYGWEAAPPSPCLPPPPSADWEWSQKVDGAQVAEPPIGGKLPTH